MARIIPTTTNSHVRINKQVITQPITLIAGTLKAPPMAKVAVTRAVLGKTKEKKVIEKDI